MFAKTIKVLFLAVTVLFVTVIYNLISGNKVPVIGHTIAFFRPIINDYKVIDLHSTIKESTKTTFKELPETVKINLIDYKVDINRPIPEKKFDYSMPYIDLGTKYNLDFEQSNYIYSDYFLFYTYGSDYQAIIINNSYYINTTDFSVPIFYLDKMYVFSDDSGRKFTDDNALYIVVDYVELVDK